MDEDEAPYKTISNYSRNIKPKARINNSSSMKAITPMNDMASSFHLMAVQSIEPKKYVQDDRDSLYSARIKDKPVIENVPSLRNLNIVTEEMKSDKNLQNI